MPLFVKNAAPAQADGERPGSHFKISCTAFLADFILVLSYSIATD
jgi:hypothetical protein